MEKLLIHDDDEVHEILSPFYRDFHEVILESFEKCKEIHALYYDDFLPIRTRSDLVRSRAFTMFKQRFFGNPDIQILYTKEDDFLSFLVKDSIALRFKKIDQNLSANFNKTRRSQYFVGQQLLFEEFMTPISLLVLGYRVNDLWTEIISTNICHPQRFFSINIGNRLKQSSSQKQLVQKKVPKQTIVHLKKEERKTGNEVG